MTEQSRIEFGTDGIRGIAGEYPLDAATVLHIGRAIGRYVRERSDGLLNVVIGRDTRISGHMLTHALTAGLLYEDVSVVSDAGVMTTPGIAYLTRHGSYDLGIVISASHNPVEQNGIKVFGPDGFKLPDKAEEIIESLIASIPRDEMSSAFGYSESFNARELYISHLTQFGAQRKLNNLKVVLDCANGAASVIAPEAFERDGARVIALNASPDGYNINVEAGSEFVRRNRDHIVDTMREQGADLGIAFDGDADRVIVVTPEGLLIDGDHLLAMLAVEYQQAGQLPGDTVIATDMSNSGLEDFLAGYNISLKRTKVGDRYVMEALRKGGFTLGGEQAGHIITLDEEHTAGDGIHVGLLVAALAARNKRNDDITLHEFVSTIPRYPQVIASAHLDARIDLAQVPGLDELRNQTLELFGGGRVNIRFSGTEPNLLRAMVEGGPGTSRDMVIEQSLKICHAVAKATNTENPEIDLVDCETGAPINRY